MLTTNEQTELDILLEMENPSNGIVSRIKYLQEKSTITETNVKKETKDSYECLSPINKQILQEAWSTYFKLHKTIEFDKPKVQQIFDTYMDQLPEGFEHIKENLFIHFPKYVAKHRGNSIKENTEVAEKFKNSKELDFLVYEISADFQKSIINCIVNRNAVMELPIAITFSFIFHCLCALDECTEFEPSYELLYYIATNLINYAESTFELPSTLMALIYGDVNAIN